jgi:hypothetical protein
MASLSGGRSALCSDMPSKNSDVSGLRVSADDNDGPYS